MRGGTQPARGERFPPQAAVGRVASRMRPPLCRWTGGGGRTALLLPCVGRCASDASVSGFEPRETSTAGLLVRSPRAPGAALAARLGPALAQRPAQLQLLLGRPLLVRAGRLEDHRQAVEARLAEEDRAAVLAQLALADVGVAVAVGAQLALGVVEVQRAEAVEADDVVALVQDLRQALGG